MKRILFTGGGSTGHVAVNLALIPKFQEAGWDVLYIGSENGIEKQLIGGLQGVPYRGIATGKLRRYFDWKNFKDPFRVVKGVWQAYRMIKQFKPDVIFSKGGFVSVPVVFGGRLCGVPIVIHESDLTPGLANKLSLPFATTICTTFPETKDHVDKAKSTYIGAIVREDLKRGDATRGPAMCGFTAHKPVLLVVGGSLGARKINQMVRDNLKTLLATYQIVHLCGKNNVEAALENTPGYKQFEYVTTEMADLLAMADVVVSRAGANAIFELAELRKPMLLIPLPKSQSRGDQIDNAKSFKRRGFAEVLFEEEMTNESFLAGIETVYTNRERYVQNMKQLKQEGEPLDRLIEVIQQTAHA